MSKILQAFDTESSFWLVEPQLKYLFNDVFDSDKSSKKQKSSDIMWAIALLIEPSSKFANLSLKERKNLIAKDFLKNEKFKWEDHKETIENYKRYNLTAAEKALIAWEEKMIERQEFIKGTKYDEETAEMLDKMLGNTKKLFDDYQRILKDLNNSEGEGDTFGGAQESAQERGVI